MNIFITVTGKGKKWKLKIDKSGLYQRLFFAKFIRLLERQIGREVTPTWKGKINLSVKYEELHTFNKFTEFSKAAAMKSIIYSVSDYLSPSLAESYYKRYLGMHYITPWYERVFPYQCGHFKKI